MNGFRPYVRELPPGYQLTLEPCQFGLYWHLHCRGERVNGGIAEDKAAAYEAARWGAVWHRVGSMITLPA